MKETDNRLIDWAIQETKAKYRNEVSLLLTHDTYCLDEDKHVRYVNTIISDARPYVGLARTFIINGIGYDFNQVSWASFERDAEAKGYYTTVLAEADIAYAKNEADKQRFLYLRAKLFANLADAAYMYERGLEWLSKAMEVYKDMMFNDTFPGARLAAGMISQYLATAVACFNQTYFSGMGHLDALCKMTALPDDFIAMYQRVKFLHTISELREASHDLITATRAFFTANNRRDTYKPAAPDYQYLAEWEQECSYYFKRIRHFCAENDADMAFCQIYNLQPDLDELAQDFGLDGMDVLAHFDADNLPALAEKVKRAESIIREAVSAHGVTLDESADVDEFLAKNGGLA